MNSTDHKYTNHLVHQSSPYLLQHAHNPVNWYPWDKDALNIAQKENKLIIISIGYAACHWCHVMEHESFADEEVAKFMNDNYVAIKVDREERPDLDQVYMNAVQLITGGGGWPLNCITLPDGRPIHGGTYFPKNQWINMLRQVNDFVRQHPDKAERQATLLTQGIRSGEMLYSNTEKTEFILSDLKHIFNTWKTNIDYTEGGHNGAPKFPLPVGYQFLLHYFNLTEDNDALKAVTTTLKKMADGGIYDQIGGGFARYSTDIYWKVPHFEKMLYDNAQLISLYSTAYQKTKDPGYKIIVTETIEFIQRELTSEEGGIYSAIDADSEGVEGKFYVWTKDELKNILGSKAELIIDYYNVTEAGNWENGLNILYKSKSENKYAKQFNISESELARQVLETKNILLKERAQRVRPVLDDKILTSWNALMLKAYIDAYRVFDDKKYLNRAIITADFIINKLKSPDNRLYRNYKNGGASINAFLDDYAFTIEALIMLYQATFDEIWLREAENLTSYSISHFYDEKKGMFYYTSDIDPALIARKMEVADNVIPSGNSQMAKNLFILGHYLTRDNYIGISKKMLSNIKENALNGNEYYSNWDILMAWFISEPYEVVIMGEDFENIRKEFDKHFLPQVFLSGGKQPGTLLSHENKLVEGQTTIYVCRGKVCNQPVTEVNEALTKIFTK